MTARSRHTRLPTIAEEVGNSARARAGLDQARRTTALMVR